MRLRSLTVRTLPGIEPGFTFEPPSTGINLVVGPNASGKSSLTRALKHLLGAERSDPHALALEAEFEDGETRWQVVRNGSQIAWRRDGAAASRPALPGAQQIGLYRLAVESLLDHTDASDQALARRLRRELLGNIDLDALRQERHSALGKQFGARQQRELNEAAKARRQVQNDYAALQQQEAELPALQTRIEAAAEAADRCQQLDRAINLAAAIADRQEREAGLRRFPPAMERLTGNELERLEALDAKADRLRDEVRARAQDLETAAAALKATGLAERMPAPEELKANTEKLRALDGLVSERDAAHKAAVQAEAAARDARTVLQREEGLPATGADEAEAAAPRPNGALDDNGAIPRIDADTMRRAERIATDLLTRRQQIAELREQLKATDEAPDPQELRRWQAAAEALHAWLAARTTEAQPTASPAPNRAPLAAGAASVVALLTAVVAAAVSALPVVVPALIAAALAAAAFLGVRRMRQAAPAASSALADAQRRFADTDVPPPTAWDQPAVRQRLRDVERECDAQRLRALRAEGADRLRQNLATAEQQLQEHEAARAALATDIGFDPTLPIVAFDRFVRLCNDWDGKRRKHHEQTAQVVDLDRRITETARSVREVLDAWPADDAPGASGAADRQRLDVDLLRGGMDRLQQRITAAEGARRDSRSAEAAMELLQRQREDVASEMRRVYVDAGGDPDDRPALAARLEQRPDWKAVKQAHDAAVTVEGLARDELKNHPELIAHVEAGGEAQIQAARDAAARDAEAHTRLIQEQQAIRTRLDDAGRDRDLERAGAEEDRARQALEDKREEALLAEATAVLLDDVEQAFKAEHEPDILRRARHIFAEVTAHAFDLLLRPDGTFAARDVAQGAERSLSELSSGTRMQLLLALRLAWTEVQEQGGAALPLFLDEALTTSDEQRFKVMAQSLERIAAAEDGRGRQIFYLSARRHEAALWRQATGSDPAVIDLEAVRFPPGAVAPEEYEVAQPAPLPAPNDGERAQDYAARLGIAPRIDLYRPPGACDIFHVLREDQRRNELPLLHRLRDTWRINSVGQLEALLASDAGQQAIPEEATRQRLAWRCRTAPVWTEYWRQGRGKPVDRGVLEQCRQAVSRRFIDEVASLADELHGDGKALVAALRAGRVLSFQSRQTDRLDQWLTDHGYIDDRDRLTPEARRRETLQRLAPETDAAAEDINRTIDWLEAAAGIDDEVA